MKEKKFTSLMWVHLIMMVVLAILSIGTAVFLLNGVTTNNIEEIATWRSSVIFNICLIMINALALISGVIYLLKGYRKDAASFYKTFMMLNAVSAVVFALMALSVMQTSNSVEGMQIASNVMYILCVFLMVIKAVLLFVLTFGQNLGKRNSWIIFCVILAIDIVVGLLFKTSGSWAPFRFVSALPRLFMAGTIGLSIKGKYDDKDARGTI